MSDKLSVKLEGNNVEYFECKYCNRLLPISKFSNKKGYTRRKIYYDKCKSCKSAYKRKVYKVRTESTDYITVKAEMAYQSMKQRCYGRSKRNWYADVTICEEWLNDKQAFIQWYREHYYEIDGLLTVVDKDLFGGISKIYSPETACLLPQTINAVLSNVNRYRFLDKETGLRLPLGVYYDKNNNKYFARIKYYGTKKVVKLSYQNTMEEAFEEYRLEKKKDIKRMADKYKSELPAYIYEALLRFEIKPY